jgi:hypothetical protein
MAICAWYLFAATTHPTADEQIESRPDPLGGDPARLPDPLGHTLGTESWTGKGEPTGAGNGDLPDALRCRG